MVGFVTLSLEGIILPSFCQAIMGTGTPSASALSTTGSPSRTDRFRSRSTNRGACASRCATTQRTGSHERAQYTPCIIMSCAY